MRCKQFWVGACALMFVAACVAGMNAQSRGVGPNTFEGHIAAGKALAGNTWLQMYSEMCGGAMAPLTPAPRVGPAPVQIAMPASVAKNGPPPRAAWYQDPVKIFDNVWAFSTPEVLDSRLGLPVHNVMALAVVTSDGIILIDATYEYSVKELIVDAMPKIGLDPRQIKYALITHNHFDHFAGAKYLQDTFGTRIIMGEQDWVGVEKRIANLPSEPYLARRDMSTGEGQKLTLGDTTITLYNTPGHTNGTTSAIIPVKDKGVTHYAALWGGTSIGRGMPYDNLVAYHSSARKMRDLSIAAGADIILTPHGRVIDFPRRAGAARAFPMGPNPFIVGQTEVKNWWDMIYHCSQAVAMAKMTGTK